MRRALVVTLGNPLMQDDGAGYAVADQLRGGGIRVEHIGTDPFMLHSVYHGEEIIVVVDAACGGIKPGEIVVLHGDEIFERVCAPMADAHHMGVVDALRLMRELSFIGDADLFMVLLGVERVKEGEGLSEAARHAAEKAAEVIRDIIRRCA